MHDLLPQLVFYVFAGMAIISGLMVISLNNPVRCVLFLVLAFFSSTVLWILVHAEFLALILILVYVGAVMTLFLFVVMMLNINLEETKTNVKKYLPFGLAVIVLFVGLLFIAMPDGVLNSGLEATVTSGSFANADFSNTQKLGMVLYTDYVLAFEMAAAILLVAIVAAITLTHRPPKRAKYQDVVKQMMVRREDRVKLIKMKSEK